MRTSQPDTNATGRRKKSASRARLDHQPEIRVEYNRNGKSLERHQSVTREQLEHDFGLDLGRGKYFVFEAAAISWLKLLIEDHLLSKETVLPLPLLQNRIAALRTNLQVPERDWVAPARWLAGTKARNPRLQKIEIVSNCELASVDDAMFDRLVDEAVGLLGTSVPQRLDTACPLMARANSSPEKPASEQETVMSALRYPVNPTLVLRQQDSPQARRVESLFNPKRQASDIPGSPRKKRRQRKSSNQALVIDADSTNADREQPKTGDSETNTRSSSPEHPVAQLTSYNADFGERYAAFLRGVSHYFESNEMRLPVSHRRQLPEIMATLDELQRSNQESLDAEAKKRPKKWCIVM